MPNKDRATNPPLEKPGGERGGAGLLPEYGGAEPLRTRPCSRFRERTVALPKKKAPVLDVVTISSYNVYDRPPEYLYVRLERPLRSK